MSRKHPRLSAEALDELTMLAVECKAQRRHRLDPIPAPPGTPRPEFGALIVLRCEICGTLAYDKVSRLTGERIANRQYFHPTGYDEIEPRDANSWRAVWYDTLAPELIMSANDGADEVGRRRRRRAS